MNLELEALQEEGLRLIKESNAQYIIGLDEVGNGSWAGCVLVAGIVFKKDWYHKRVKDSKQFHNSSGSTAHEKRKDVLYSIILKNSVGHLIMKREAKEIDLIGIGACLKNLFESVAIRLKEYWSDSIIIIDGNYNFPIEGQLISMPKADIIVPAVSAASILAKVTRDNIMIEADKAYPQYGFAKSVGYGTVKHIQALKKYGPCLLHRLSYRGIQRILGDRLLFEYPWNTRLKQEMPG